MYFETNERIRCKQTKRVFTSYLCKIVIAVTLFDNTLDCMTRFIIQLYIFSFDRECTIIPLPFPPIYSLIGCESIIIILLLEIPRKKIYNWKNEICTLWAYSVPLPNFALSIPFMISCWRPLL